MHHLTDICKPVIKSLSQVNPNTLLILMWYWNFQL